MYVYFNKLNYLLFSLVLILYPINHKLVLFFRPSDLLIFILIFSFFTLYRIKFDYILIIFLILICIFLSTIFSSSYYLDTNFVNYIFIYKILAIIIIISCIHHFSKFKDSKVFHKILFSLFIFQIIWVFIYAILLKFGLDGNVRVSYAFSSLEDRRMSDAHLYGNLLSLSLIYYLMFWKKYFNIHFTITILIVFFTLVAVAMTGSKNPILLLLIYFIFVSLPYLIKKTSFKILFKIFIIFFIIFFTFSNQIIEIYYFITDFLSQTKYQALFNRVYNSIIKPVGDDSIFGRIKNVQIAISQTYYSSGFFGKGLNGSFKYYDGIHSLIISLGGFTLLIVLILSIAFNYIKIIVSYKNREIFINYLIFFSLVIISNIITEFIFVIRWMIPIISMLTLLYLDCFKPSINKSHLS